MAGKGGKRPGAGRPKGSSDVAPKVVAAWFKGLDQLVECGGISGLADVFQELIAQDPVKALEILARFLPRQVDAQVESNETKAIYYVAVPQIAEDHDKWFERHSQKSLTKQ